MKYNYNFTFLFGTSTFFDEDDGWVTIPLNGFFRTRTFEINGWKCYQACKDGIWYDIDPDPSWAPEYFEPQDDIFRPSPEDLREYQMAGCGIDYDAPWIK